MSDQNNQITLAEHLILASLNRIVKPHHGNISIKLRSAIPDLILDTGFKADYINKLIAKLVQKECLRIDTSIQSRCDSVLYKLTNKGVKHYYVK